MLVKRLYFCSGKVEAHVLVFCWQPMKRRVEQCGLWVGSHLAKLLHQQHPLQVTAWKPVKFQVMQTWHSVEILIFYLLTFTLFGQLGWNGRKLIGAFSFFLTALVAECLNWTKHTLSVISLSIIIPFCQWCKFKAGSLCSTSLHVYVQYGTFHSNKTPSISSLKPLFIVVAVVFPRLQLLWLLDPYWGKFTFS